MIDEQKQNKLRIHLTNITGLGATRLLESLLPKLDSSNFFKSYELHLPDRGILSNYKSDNQNAKTVIYKRILPNSISRFIECLFPSACYDDGLPILVLGDIPLRIKKSNQVLFLQSSLLVKPWFNGLKFNELKYLVAKIIFYFNLPYVKAVIVQTSVMRDKLLSVYPFLVERIHVIAQPVPEWIISADKKKSKSKRTKINKLNLIYPAYFYPHKNHEILKKISTNQDWPISNLILTIDEEKNPAPFVDWINCCGQLNREMLLKKYKNVDGILFLSKEESYGFPLIEAMYLDLPIICPNLSFARVLCGDEAIYFDPNDIYSLKSQIFLLRDKLQNGWEPNWKNQMEKIPHDWEAVANEITSICS